MIIHIIAPKNIIICIINIIIFIKIYKGINIIIIINKFFKNAITMKKMPFGHVALGFHP
jgi:hypothetical protein